MAVFTMVQWKGGVGKSTLAVHIAASLGAVLVDLEPWGGATAWWAGARATELWQASGHAPVLQALERGRAPRPRKGEAGRPPLVPSHQELLSLTDGVAAGRARWQALCGRPCRSGRPNGAARSSSTPRQASGLSPTARSPPLMSLR